ncbi:MAG: hypothetical protein VW804_03320, partial [Verrucomicrobiota bacterium]
ALIGQSLVDELDHVDLDDLLDLAFPNQSVGPVADLHYLVNRELLSWANVSPLLSIDLTALRAGQVFTESMLTSIQNLEGESALLQEIESALQAEDRKAAFLSLVDAGFILRENLIDLQSTHVDSLVGIAAVDIQLLQNAGLIDEVTHEIDLDDLLDTPFVRHGDGPLITLAELVALGLVDAKDFNGLDLDFFGLSNQQITLDGNFGLDLVGLRSDATADMRASVRATLGWVVDLDDLSQSTDGSPSWFVDNPVLEGHLSFRETDLDVAARLGFIGVTLADVSGLESVVEVDLTRKASYLNEATDNRFALPALLSGALSGFEQVTFGQDDVAEAVLRGIKVNTGIGGIPLGHDAVISFTVDPTLTKEDQAYLHLDMQDLPGIFEISQWLRLEDLLSGLLQARQYMREAFAKLPFWVTDPNSPIYEESQDLVIPGLGISPLELVKFIGRLDEAVDTVQRVMYDPDNDIQKLIGMVLDMLLGESEEGEEDDSNIQFEVWMQGNVMRLRLVMETPELRKSLPFDLDLSTIGNLAEGFEGMDHVASFEASGEVELQLYALARLEAGIDLGPRKDNESVDKFLFDWDPDLSQGTRVEAGFKVLGQDLNVAFSLFDSIGVETIQDAHFDLTGSLSDGPDGQLDQDEMGNLINYGASFTIDRDGDAHTNAEQEMEWPENIFEALEPPQDGQPGYFDDFVKVSFVLAQSPNLGMPDDGLFHLGDWQSIGNTHVAETL